MKGKKYSLFALQDMFIIQLYKLLNMYVDLHVYLMVHLQAIPKYTPLPLDVKSSVNSPVSVSRITILLPSVTVSLPSIKQNPDPLVRVWKISKVYIFRLLVAIYQQPGMISLFTRSPVFYSVYMYCDCNHLSMPQQHLLQMHQTDSRNFETK